MSRIPKIGDKPSLPWHAYTQQEVEEKLVTSLEGLQEHEIPIRITEYGKNILPLRKPPSIFKIFSFQFKSPLIYVLMAAAFISLVLDHITDAAFIGIVITLNAIIGTVQEWKSEKNASELRDLFKITTLVRRSGKERKIPAEDLVPGDLVHLEAGDRVPADIRIISSYDCSIDESVLTGESVPIQKQADILSEQIIENERSNITYAGTTVTKGRCSGYVFNSGIFSSIGRIAEAVSETESEKPPLVKRMEEFSKIIAGAVLAAIVILAIIAVFQGMSLVEIFFFSVALAVSAIPEGLPVALTVVLSIAASRMAKRQVIIRKMTAVESLGSCTLIASDKTGTLTLNEQTAMQIILPEGISLMITGSGYSGDGDIIGLDGSLLPLSWRDTVHHLSEVATLCSEASLNRTGETWEYTGDPIDIAFLALAHKAGVDTTDLIRKTYRPHIIPFDADRRYAASLYQDGKQLRGAIKGAVESVLPRCRTMMTPDGLIPINHALQNQMAEELASKGFRVLAVAQTEERFRDGENGFIDFQDQPLTLLGLVGFIDPVRSDARNSVKACQKAGVTVVMITGDHPKTAYAIASELGIASNEQEILTGTEIEERGSTETPEFFEMIRLKRVFARVSPIQKLSIVGALIRSGHYVAVTGDGVNDAPALRKAHIGVAMGSGSDIAKETALMIIADDRFSSIVAGIEEGRYAYDNIRKVTWLLVSTGAAEVIFFTLSIIAGLPIPLLAVQLLWLNLVTNGIQHIGLACEPGESEAMNRPPRLPGEGIFNRLMVTEVLISSLVMGLIGFVAWYYFINTGWNEDNARNMAVLLFVLLENVHIFNCRSEHRSVFNNPLRKNLFLLFSVIAAQSIHQIAMHIPILQNVLGLAPVSLFEWLTLFGLALIIILVMEIFKAGMHRKERLKSTGTTGRIIPG